MTEPEQDQSLGGSVGRIVKRIFGTVFAGGGLVTLLVAAGCVFAVSTKTATDMTGGTCLFFILFGLAAVGAGIHVILFPDKWTGEGGGSGGG